MSRKTITISDNNDKKYDFFTPKMDDFTTNLEMFQGVSEAWFRVAEIADSTFDNEAWLAGGPGKDIVFEGRAAREEKSNAVVAKYLAAIKIITDQLQVQGKKLALSLESLIELSKQLLRNAVGINLPPLSIEQYVKLKLAIQFPSAIKIFNCSCDGATTDGILKGLIRGSVFDQSSSLPRVTYKVFESIPDYIPLPSDTKPYTDGAGKQIEIVDHINLAIGGNNFRVYLYIVGKLMHRSELLAERILKGGPIVCSFISKRVGIPMPGLQEVISKTQNDIYKITEKILKKNENDDSTITLWILYYISYLQDKHYGFYKILRFIGKVFEWGDELDAIYHLTTLLFAPIVNHFSKNPRLSIADPTRIMNLFDNDSYVSQIEPSGQASIILGDARVDIIVHLFSFLVSPRIKNGLENILPPVLLLLICEYYGIEFEPKKTNLFQFGYDNVLIKKTIKDWRPVHPKEIFAEKILKFNENLKSIQASINNNDPHVEKKFSEIAVGFTVIFQQYKFCEPYLVNQNSEKLVISMLLMALLAMTPYQKEQSYREILKFSINIVSKNWKNLKGDSLDEEKLGTKTEAELQNILITDYGKQWQEPQAIKLFQCFSLRDLLILATDKSSLLGALNHVKRGIVEPGSFFGSRSKHAQLVQAREKVNELQNFQIV